MANRVVGKNKLQSVDELLGVPDRDCENPCIPESSV